MQNLADMAKDLKKQRDNAPPGKKSEIAHQLNQTLQAIDAPAEQAPHNEKRQLEAAQTFLAADEPPRALKRADLAVNLAPQDPQARIVRAESYAKMHRYEEAAADARLALKLDPGNREALAVLQLTAGRTSGEAGRTLAAQTAAALPDMGQARPQPAAAPPNFPGGQETADHLKALQLNRQAQGKLGLGDAGAAAALLDRAIALDPANAGLFLARARARLAADKTRTSTALDDARRAVALAPQDGAAHIGLALILEVAGASAADILREYQAAAELDATTYTPDYQAALARWHDSPTTAAHAASTRGGKMESGPPAQNTVWGRLPETARRGLPWLGLAAFLGGGAWLWLAKKQAS